MKLKSYIFQIALMTAGAGVLGSCEDMLEPESTYVMYDENHLTGPADTANSLIGIIYKLEAIGDRVNLLGEVRGDLVSVKTSAEADLQALANFEVTDENKYNNPRDYYAIINNCNYFIHYADTMAYDNRGNQIFEKEMAQVKAIRAWTYLQLALTYGKVPFYDKPLLTEQDADEVPVDVGSRKDIKGICDYFISDLEPYADTEWPSLYTVGSILMANCYFPVDVVLGDLYLWRATYTGSQDDYRNAARHYWGWITAERNSGGFTKSIYRVWPVNTEWVSMSTNLGNMYMRNNYYSTLFSSYSSRENLTSLSWSTQVGDVIYSVGGVAANQEFITIIPMDSASSQGYFNQVRGLYNYPTDDASQTDFSISPSDRMLEISQSQSYCIVDRYGQIGEMEPSETVDDVYRGDLRLGSIWNTGTFNTTTGGMADQTTMQTITKLNHRNIVVYRQSDVWLRLAEALNNGGFPRMAYAILATGLSTDVVNDSVLAYCDRTDSVFINEMNTVDNLFSTFTSRAGTQAIFDENEYVNNIGIHSRGSGVSEWNPAYAYPMVDTLDVDGTLKDSYNGNRKDWAYQNMEAEKLAVDSMIINEMALETCFEGKRFYDLVRWAERYGKAEWVADAVSQRNAASSALRAKLMNKNNWFLKWNGQIGME